MKHFIKDMKLALIEANRKGLSLDVLSMVLANYEELEAEGYGELGTQALIKMDTIHWNRITENCLAILWMIIQMRRVVR